MELHLKKTFGILELLPPSKVEVAISGGKDSLVLYHLCGLVGTGWNFIHNMTGLDTPETMKYIRDFGDIKIRPGSFFKLVEINGFPTRVGRWCCKLLKHRRGEYQYIFTGIRKDESRKRAEREIIEPDKTKKRYPYTLIHPLFEWTTRQIMEYVEENNLRLNPMYEDRGRVGCICCPYHNPKLKKADSERYPAIKKALIKAFDLRIAYVINRGLKPLTFKTGEELFDWWISR